MGTSTHSSLYISSEAAANVGNTVEMLLMAARIGGLPGVFAFPFTTLDLADEEHERDQGRKHASTYLG